MASSWIQSGNVLPFPRGAGSCDQDNAHSPYRLQFHSISAIQGGSLVCFRVLLTPCDPASYCCSGQDLFKAEMDVEPVCKSSVKRVLLDGQQHDFEFNSALRLLRIPALDRDAGSAAGTRICLALTGLCTDLATLCAGAAGQCRYALFNSGKRDCCPTGAVGAWPPPGLPPRSPPPPPPPVAKAAATSTGRLAVPQHKQDTSFSTEFPYADCHRDPRLSRYSLSDATVTPAADSADGLTRMCFHVQEDSACSNGGRVGSSCCEFDLQKVEFAVSHQCSRALSYVSVGGALRPPFFATGVQPSIKVMNLNLPISSAGGTEICLFLRRQCATLEQLCGRADGRCEYSIFSAKLAGGDRCCPVGSAGINVDA